MPDGFNLVLHAQAELGEGPMWDERDGVLMWIDIYRAQLHRFDPITGRNSFIRMPSSIGAVAVRAQGGYIAALADGVWAIDYESGDAELLVKLPSRGDAIRFNDGKCDPQGRFWAGTIAIPPGARSSGDASVFQSLGALYRLDTALTLTESVKPTTVSNGLGWSPDGTKFYYIDSAEKSVDCFDFDGAQGALGNRRRLVELDSLSTADGMAVDAEGGLWVTLHRAGVSYLNRYSPDGTLDRKIHMPIPGITSCAFGGADLDQLYITTRRTGVDRMELMRIPHAGGIFCYRPGVRGVAVGAFNG